MTLKTLLAPMTGTKADQRILDTALAMAATTGAHIQAVFMHRDPTDVVALQLGDGMGSAAIEPLIEAAKSQVEKNRQVARSVYDHWLKSNASAAKPKTGTSVGLKGFAGVTSEFMEAVGNLPASMARLGRMADVICVLRQGANVSADWSLLAESALIDTGKAVLLAPAKKPMQPITSIAVAWNGSQEAARAVALAMPLLEAASRVTVLASTSADLTADDVEAFAQSLKRHQSKVSVQLFKSDSSDIAKKLQAKARKAEAQLLVVGAYSHSRFRQFVFGGVTDDLLKGGEMPVLMAH